MTEMTCAEARALLLDADPALLQGHGDAPLARHVKECADCARAARAILSAQTELADALETLTMNAARPAEPARATTPLPTAPDDAAALSARRSTRVARHRWLRVAAPLAAAAALTLVLWQDQVRDRFARFEPIVLPEEHVPATPVVNVPEGGTVAVMRTSNPNITIVWHLES